MPRAKRKKTTSPSPAKDPRTSLPLDPLRTGMPALDSITGVKEFRQANKVYRLIQTNEVDEYERLPSKTRRKKLNQKS